MMTAAIPNVIDTGRYTVTQTALALGIHRNTLGSYTCQGLIKCGYRRGTGRKFYEGREILRFWSAKM
jgi:DNA-binding transcriptional MerR regulator